MSDERHRRLKELFLAARERPPAERGRFLAEACGDDTELLREAESLLVYDRGAGTGTGPLAGDAGVRLLETPESAALAPGTVVAGRYRIVELSGRGGMGEVYRADDLTLDQPAALKFLTARGGGLTARFLDEVRLARSISHPNVCRVHDVGEADGRHFLSMEWIDGEDLASLLARRERLEIGLALELARQLAGGLAAAHRQGVLHRDLKPANLMLDAGGTLKITDFGLAQLAESRGPEVLSGTPAYMAPEQHAGEEVSARSDLYALGLVLYELFTGRPPFEAGSVAELIQAQRTAPSGPRALVAELDPSIDGVILACLEPEPGRRPASAGAVTEILESATADWPRRLAERRAREEAEATRRALARSQKRRRWLAGTTLALVFFGAFMTWQARRASREAAAAREVSDFLVELFQVSDPRRGAGGEITARELLERGARRIEEELSDQPEIQARLMDTVGVVYHNLGLYDAAVPLLEAALERRRERHGEAHPEVAEVLHNLGWALDMQGDLARAEALLRQALDQRRRFLGAEHPDVAATLYRLGWVLYGRSDYAAAQPLFEQALDQRRRLLGDDHPAAIESLGSLGWSLLNQGDLAGAETLFREAVVRHRRILGEEHPDLADSLSSLAWALLKRGAFEEAEPLFLESLDLRRRLLGEEHPDVTASLNYLGGLYQAKGEPERAEPVFRQALELRRRILGEHPRVSNLKTRLAGALRAQGRLEEAETLLRQALEVNRRLLGPVHRDVAVPLHDLAALLHGAGDAEAAEPLVREAVEIFARVFPPGHPRTVEARHLHRRILAASGRDPAATGG